MPGSGAQSRIGRASGRRATKIWGLFAVVCLASLFTNSEYGIRSAVVRALEVAPAGYCAEGWVGSRESATNEKVIRCYYIVPTVSSYDGAQAKCEDTGVIDADGEVPTLFIMDSADEGNFVADHVPILVNAWIALTRETVADPFVWEDGTALTDSRWQAGNPTTSAQDLCVDWRWDADEWTDRPCWRTRRALCEARGCPAGKLCDGSNVRNCGGIQYYCVGGVRYAVDPGYASIGGTPETRTGQQPCVTPGFYCLGGQSLPCPAGRFASSSGSGSAACEGPCRAGYYCPTASVVDDANECGGNNVYCPAGSGAPQPVTPGYYSTGPSSTRRTGQSVCPLGMYCVDGVQAECPAGRYGGTTGLASAVCSGLCQGGYFCEAGAQSRTQNECGSVDKFCPEESESPRDVQVGYFSAPVDLPVTVRSRESICTAGHYCVVGERHPCPGGRYGSSEGETDPQCEGACRQGYFCVAGSTSRNGVACGSREVYCPAGSGEPIPVSSGHYAVPEDSPDKAYSEEVCRAPYYCEDGNRYLCAAGRYGATDGLAASTCSGNCAGGYYCPVGSISATQHECGGADRYCPAGSSAPRTVTAGYFTTGESAERRSGQSPCPAGSYCINGVRSLCPVGRYGDEDMLASVDCSGQCSAGFHCPAGTANPWSTPCYSANALFYCKSGLQLQVSSGTYSVPNLVESPPGSGDIISVNVDSLRCPAGTACASGAKRSCEPGTYQPQAGQQSCLACPAGKFCPGESGAGLGTVTPASCGGPEFYCPMSSTSPTRVTDGYYTVGGDLSEDAELRVLQVECPVGSYCGDGVRALCPAGRFGNATGLTSAECSGHCTAGCACPAGSVTACSVACTDAQYYCPSESGAPVLVSLGYYSHGTVDDASGVVRLSQQLACPAGQYCASGVARPCPAGRFYSGLRASECTGECSAGWYCPTGSATSRAQPCDALVEYCPAGSEAPTSVQPGWFAVAVDDHSDDGSMVAVHVSVEECPPGWWCVAGVKSLCPAGRFGASHGLRSPWCDGPCEAGYFCPAGSVTATAESCGSPAVFCPVGSADPLRVPEGYVSAVIDVGAEADSIVESFETVASGWVAENGEHHPGCTAAEYANTNHSSGAYVFASAGGIRLIRSPTYALPFGAELEADIAYFGNESHAAAHGCGDGLDIPVSPSYSNAFLEVSLDGGAEYEAARYVRQTRTNDVVDGTLHTVSALIPPSQSARLRLRQFSSDGSAPLWALYEVRVRPFAVQSGTASAATARERSATAECGSKRKYCVDGLRLPIPIGTYSDGGTEVTRSRAIQCPEGYYCPGDGDKYECVLGTVCPVGSIAAELGLCGSVQYYCPDSASDPIHVDSGYYSVTSEDGESRIAQERCGSPEFYCVNGSKLAALPGEATVGGPPDLRTAVEPCGNVSVYCSAGERFVTPPGYQSIGGATAALHSSTQPCTRPQYFCAGGVSIRVQERYFSVPVESEAPRTGEDFCLPGHYCVDGSLLGCPPGTFSGKTGLTRAADCAPCPAGRFSNATAATSSDVCVDCPSGEGSMAGAGECWPALIKAEAVAMAGGSQSPGLSTGDSLRLTFNRATSGPSLTSQQALDIVDFSEPVASAVAARWEEGGKVLIVELLSVEGAGDPLKTAVGALQVRVQRGSGDVEVLAASGQSQAMSTEFVTVAGSWGEQAAPQIVSAVAFDGVPSQAGTGTGDTLHITFDQEISEPLLDSRLAVDRLVSLGGGLAHEYVGSWSSDRRTLIVTVLDMGHHDPFASSRAIGTFEVSIMPAGNLRSRDGSSQPASGSVVVSQGTWGDAPTDVHSYVFSSTALLVSFRKPEYAEYPVLQYLVSWSVGARTFGSDLRGPEGDDTLVTSYYAEHGGWAIASAASGSGGTFVIQNLTTDVPVFVRVAADNSGAYTNGPAKLFGPWRPAAEGAVVPTTPRVTSIATVSSLGTAGGEEIIFMGEALGAPAGVNTVTARSSNGNFSSLARECAVLTTQSVRCVSGPGVGRKHRWKLTVNGIETPLTPPDVVSHYAPPAITGFGGIGADSGSTEGGDDVVINGVNFGNESEAIQDVVYSAAGFGDQLFRAQNCQLTIPHEQLVCKLGKGAGESLHWTVTVGHQQSVLPSTRYQQPAIAGVYRPFDEVANASLSAFELSTQGREPILINGSQLGPMLPEVSVSATYGPSGREFTALDCKVVESSTVIECLTAAGGSGTGHRWRLQVHGVYSLPSPQLTGYARPHVSSVTPAAVPTNGGATVRIKGTNFGSGGDILVYFDGLEVADFALRQAHSELSVLVPAGTGKNKEMSLVVAGQQSDPFYVSYLPPTIASLDIRSVSVNGSALLSILGSNFGVSSVHVSVVVGSSQCLVTSVDHGEIQCWTAASAGIVSVEVWSECQGSIDATDGSSTVQCDKQRTISSIENEAAVFSRSSLLSRPVVDRIGAPGCEGDCAATGPTHGGFNISITGSGFKRSGSVQFIARNPPQSAPVESYLLNCRVISWDAEEVVCEVPAGQGAYDVVVSTGALSSPPARFEFEAPELLTVTPTVVSTAGETELQLIGLNLGLGGTVSVTSDDATECVVTSWGHELVTCIIGPGSAPEISVSLRSAGIPTRDFAVNRPGPLVISVNPSLIPTRGGVIVEVSGTNFAAAGNITIGGLPCEVVNYTHTGARCVAPPGHGTQRVLTIRTLHQAASFAMIQYEAPVVENVSHGVAPARGGFDILISGHNFGTTGAIVHVGAATGPVCSVIRQKHSEIVCAAPGGVGGDLHMFVTIAGQTARSNTTMAYDPPQVGELRPNIGDARAGTPNLIVIGTNFGHVAPPQGQLIVWLDDMGCDNAAWVSNERVKCDVPSALPVGSMSLTVRVANQTSNSHLMFLQCSEGFFGAAGEMCSICPQGALCPGGNADPYPRAGFWRSSRSVFLACSPAHACPGGADSPCAAGYTGSTCSMCAEQHYRLKQECLPCPDTAWLLFLSFFAALALLAAIAAYLNKKRINLAGLSIGVDFLQISSMFLNFNFSWPDELRLAFSLVSSANLNIDVVAPECAVEWSWPIKFFATQSLPLLVGASLLLAFALADLWSRCAAVYVRCRHGLIRSRWGADPAVKDDLIGTGFTALYYVYFITVTNGIAVFDCNTNLNGEVTMDADPSILCFQGIHATMIPFGWASLALYGVGIPLFFGVVVFYFRAEIRFDQALKARGEGDNDVSNPAFHIRKRYKKVYEDFRPQRYYWRIVLIARKAALATVALLFNTNPMFQASLSIAVIFASYVVHVRAQPFLPRASVSTKFLRLGDNVSPSPGSRKKAGKKGSKRASVIRMSREAAQSSMIKYTFDYNTLESAFLIGSLFILLSGMVFESAAVPRGTTSYTVLSVTVVGVIIFAIVAFLGVLCFELYRSIKFANILAKAREHEMSLSPAAKDGRGRSASKILGVNMESVHQLSKQQNLAKEAKRKPSKMLDSALSTIMGLPSPEDEEDVRTGRPSNKAEWRDLTKLLEANPDVKAEELLERGPPEGGGVISRFFRNRGQQGSDGHTGKGHFVGANPMYSRGGNGSGGGSCADSKHTPGVGHATGSQNRAAAHRSRERTKGAKAPPIRGDPAASGDPDSDSDAGGVVELAQRPAKPAATPPKRRPPPDPTAAKRKLALKQASARWERTIAAGGSGGSGTMPDKKAKAAPASGGNAERGSSAAAAAAVAASLSLAPAVDSSSSAKVTAATDAKKSAASDTSVKSPTRRVLSPSTTVVSGPAATGPAGLSFDFGAFDFSRPGVGSPSPSKPTSGRRLSRTSGGAAASPFTIVSPASAAAAVESQPEPDWVQYWSEEKEAYYYGNSVTGEVTWVAPDSYVPYDPEDE